MEFAEESSGLKVLLSFTNIVGNQSAIPSTKTVLVAEIVAGAVTGIKPTLSAIHIMFTFGL